MNARRVAKPVLSTVAASAGAKVHRDRTAATPPMSLASRSAQKRPSPKRPSPKRASASVAEPAVSADARTLDVPAELRAVWRLASGVANDFNNILQVIAGNAETLLHEMPPGGTCRNAAQSIADAARRASTLTHQLLAFGRRQALASAPVDLSALITEVLPQLRRQVRPQVRIVTHLAAKLPCVHADKCQLAEVLSHLGDNASDAMPDGGTLSIVTDVVNVGAQMRRLRPWLRPGRFVRLELADSGQGLDPQSVANLFEPFHTTRARCGGGLGLSAAYGIVKQSGGFIWVESESGQGTRITVLLPVAAEAAAATEMFSSGPRARVLLVEDDDDVRELLDGVLMTHGFSVASYGSAEEALDHPGPYDLLLTDILLPGLNGPELAREVARRTPTVPVLMMSGDAGNVPELEHMDPRRFLQKPFSTDALVSRVEELLSM